MIFLLAYAYAPVPAAITQDPPADKAYPAATASFQEKNMITTTAD
jgi:hypothetical protein